MPPKNKKKKKRNFTKKKFGFKTSPNPNVYYSSISENVLKTHENYYSIHRRCKNREFYKKLRKDICKIKRVGKKSWKLGYKLFKDSIPQKRYRYIPQGGIPWKYSKIGSLGGSSAFDFIRLYLKPYRRKLKLKSKMEKKNNLETVRKVLDNDSSEKIFDDIVKVFLKYGTLHEPNNILSVLKSCEECSILEYGYKILELKDYPESWEENPFIMKWLPKIGASPDGIIVLDDSKWLLECKAKTVFIPLNPKKGEEKTEKTNFFFKDFEVKGVDIKHIVQLLHNCIVYKLDAAVYSIYKPHATYVFRWLNIDKRMIEIYGIILSKCNMAYQLEKEKKIKSHLDYEIKELDEFIEMIFEVEKEMNDSLVKIKSQNDFKGINKEKFLEKNSLTIENEHIITIN